MSIQEPAWLKRSRPCPFYSQGRCLFADSCNFLHDGGTVGQPVQVNQLQPVSDLPSVVVDSASPRSHSQPSPDTSASTLHDSSRYSGLLSVLSDVIGPPCIPHSPSEDDVLRSRTIPDPCNSEQSLILPFGSSETALVGAIVTMESAFPEDQLQLVPDGSMSSIGNTASYFVEDGVLDGEGIDDCSEDDPAVRRQSILSSFTGASLLASPRNSASFVSTPFEDGAADLLSPVHLSAQLRPFPIPPRLSRGDSIDSGYADGDSWVSPHPFPCSPPRNFPSPFLHHSRQTSFSSLFDQKLSHGVTTLPPSLHNLAEVKEVEGDVDLDNGDTPYAACDRSRSDEQKRIEACSAFHVVVAEEQVEEDYEPPEVPAVACCAEENPTDHLHPTREYDLDSSNPPSFASDDNLSFKTALSTQPSYDDLNDTCEVSPVKQDPLLPSISSRSTPNFSTLSPCDDANTLSAPVATLDMALRMDGVRPSGTRASICSCPQDVSINPEVTFASASTHRNVVSPRESQTDLFHVDERSPLPTPSVDLSLAEGTLGHIPHDSDSPRRFTAEKVITPRRRSLVAFGSPPKSSSSTFHSPTLVKDPLYQNSALGDVASPWTLDHDQRSPKSSLSTENSPSSFKDALGEASSDADDNDSRHLEPSSIPSGNLTKCTAMAGAGQGLIMENNQELDDTLQPVHTEHDNFAQHLSFPLPPPFLPAEFVEHSALDDRENESILSEAAALDLEQRLLTILQHEQGQHLCLSPDKTQKVRPSCVPSFGSPASDAVFALQRSRAASDTTVKGKSAPTSAPGDVLYVPTSPQPAWEKPGLSDSMQSFHSQCRYDNASEDGLESSSPLHRNTGSLPAMFGPKDELSEEDPQQSQPLDCFIPKESHPCSDTQFGTTSSDASRSGTILRPLLTGRRSLLRSSLVELVPKANLAKASSPHLSARLQVREIGSTMVPLGFRRHKPQPAPTQSSCSSSQTLHHVLPASELREVLRIRTDIVRHDLPLGCSSATQASSETHSPLPVLSMSAPPSSGLRQLRLSSVIHKRSSVLSTHSSSISSSILSIDHIFNASTPQSPSVSSVTSFSHNSLFSSSCEQISEQIHHTLKRFDSYSLIPQATDDVSFTSHSSTRRNSRSISTPIQQPKSWRLSHYRAGSRSEASANGFRRVSRRTSTLNLSYAADEHQENGDMDSTESLAIESPHTGGWMRPASILATPVHAIATPKPTLLFAIASDDVSQVRQVLESGEAGPNDPVGPQSALAFTLTNDKLAHKQEIVKALLAYGANPSALRNPTLNPPPRVTGDIEPGAPPPETTLEGMDPATRYFVARADATHTRQTSHLIHRSFFRPLTRVQYDVIGQDWALEQLFRVLGMHSQKLSVAPIVVLLCGPSGHGKSLLARKFGSLLDVPTHTVNMTTLRSTHDIWQSYSMSPYEEPSSCTLAEFLIENEEKRCIVVLDEIEKVEDQKALWSLLMPWELGRCSLEAGKRHVDARNVIWIGTSNIGHTLVFEHHENRVEQNKRMSREEYLELTGQLRPHVSNCLGASLVSRVTAVLPFVPFTLGEKKAIAAEAVYALAGDAGKTLTPQDVESLVMKALMSYQPSEGARSLHRAISNILVDAT